MSAIVPGMISVIVPTYNRLGMLRALLETVYAQEDCGFEILVVDDGSTDGTEAAMTAEDGRVLYLRNERNSGPGFSRRRGFLASRGEYVVFADDDDYYTDPSFFFRAVNTLREDADRSLAFAAANARILYEDTGELREAPLRMSGRIRAADYLRGFSGEYPKPLSTFPAVFRREALERGGLRDTVQTDDRVIYLRALLAGDAFILPESAGVYRVHGSNLSSSVSAEFTVTLHRENRAVYDEIRRRGLLEEPEDWWYDQAWIALRFYIQNPGSDLRGLRTIFRFLRSQHISAYRDAVLFRRALGYWLSRRRSGKNG